MHNNFNSLARWSRLLADQTDKWIIQLTVDCQVEAGCRPCWIYYASQLHSILSAARAAKETWKWNEALPKISNRYGKVSGKWLDRKEAAEREGRGEGKERAAGNILCPWKKMQKKWGQNAKIC